MRLRTFLPVVALTFVIAMSAGCGGPKTVNIGDGSVGNMIWGVFHHAGTGDYDTSIAYADKMLELHGAEASKQQASLSDYPPTDPASELHKYRVLNNVGAAIWVKGELLERKGDKIGAIEAYTTLARDYGYAQWLDWPAEDKYLKGAEAAEMKLAELRAATD